MMAIANRIMAHRSQLLMGRLRPHLPLNGIIADIGSGTGHNAEEIRRHKTVSVQEFDVVDLHWVGPGPQMIHGTSLPADRGAFDAVLLLFVLQYLDSPQDLLNECARISRGPLIVIQSTYRGRWGRIVLTIREFVWGRLAHRLAVLVGILQVYERSLNPRRYFTFPELILLFEETGFVVEQSSRSDWRWMSVSRDLFVLKRKAV